jgi:excisionase family DNA binding protein
MTTKQGIAGGSSTLPRLISVEEAATLLAVTDTTVRNWIKSDAIPYIELPSSGSRKRYRIPLQGLLNTLAGNYDLGADVGHLNAVFGGEREDVHQSKETADRALPRGGRAVELDADTRDLFDHAQARND